MEGYRPLATRQPARPHSFLFHSLAAAKDRDRGNRVLAECWYTWRGRGEEVALCWEGDRVIRREDRAVCGRDRAIKAC